MVGATGEDSAVTGIDGTQDDNSASGSGATYLFHFDGFAWSQTSFIKASNPERWDAFGHPVVLSADSSTLAVGAVREDSAATTINGNQNDNTAESSGAAYLN